MTLVASDSNTELLNAPKPLEYWAKLLIVQPHQLSNQYLLRDYRGAFAMIGTPFGDQVLSDLNLDGEAIKWEMAAVASADGAVAPSPSVTDFMEALVREYDRLVPEPQYRLLPQPGEEVYLVDKTASLWGWRRQPSRGSGTTTGVSVRVGRGVYVHSGGYSPQGGSGERVHTAIASGELILTDRRLAFTANYKSFATPLRRIRAVEVHDWKLHVAHDQTVTVLSVPRWGPYQWEAYVRAAIATNVTAHG